MHITTSSDVRSNAQLVPGSGYHNLSGCLSSPSNRRSMWRASFETLTNWRAILCNIMRRDILCNIMYLAQCSERTAHYKVCRIAAHVASFRCFCFALERHRKKSHAVAQQLVTNYTDDKPKKHMFGSARYDYRFIFTIESAHSTMHDLCT